jgi:hypothetical protein
VIRHVVLLTFKGGTTDAQVDALARALRGLPARLPKIRSYKFGRDAGINADQASFAVVADFDNEADYVEYRDDAEHRRIITELIVPILASRTAAQYEI